MGEAFEIHSTTKILKYQTSNYEFLFLRKFKTSIHHKLGKKLENKTLIKVFMLYCAILTKPDTEKQIRQYVQYHNRWNDFFFLKFNKL